jgi:hypothetical protein
MIIAGLVVAVIDGLAGGALVGIIGTCLDNIFTNPGVCKLPF